MKHAKVLMIGASLLLAAGTAFADGDGEGSGSAAPPAPDANGANGAGQGSAMSATATAGGGAAGAWSDELISNTLTMPKSALGVYGTLGLATSSVTIVDPTTGMSTTSSSTAENLGIGAGYGISDKLTIGGEYAVPLHDDAGTFPNSGALTVYGGYNVMSSGKLSVAAGADLSLAFDSTDFTLDAGVTVRYSVAPKFAVFTGNPVAPGILGNQLSIGLYSNAPIVLSIPVGVAFQASPQLYAWADTILASFLFAPASANAFIFSDFIPIQVGALYRATKDIDVGAALTDDLKDAGNTFGIALMARYYKR